MAVEPILWEENPLGTLGQDYGQATIHLAWGFNNTTRERTLLFATVELLPLEVPSPYDEGEQKFLLRGSRGYRLFTRHIVTSAGEALAWYRSCAVGCAPRPDDDGKFLDTQTPANLFQNLAWEEEPRWPHLTCTADATLTPFIDKWHQCPRVHHLIATNFNLETHWNNIRDREEAAEWLERQIGFDLRLYVSLWGSIHLIAPNPVFRTFHYTLGKHLREGFQTVAYKVDFRSGKRSSELTLIVRDDTTSGTGLMKTVPIGKEIGAFLVNKKLSLQCIYVVDKFRGLLHAEESFLFLDGISATSQLITATREVKDEHGNALFAVPLVGSQRVPIEINTSHADISQPQHAAAILQLEHNLQRQRREARESNEQWFQGDEEAAVQVVRKLLRTASQRVLIVDPYFRRSELSFALSVSNTEVPIRILASAKELKKKITETSTYGEQLLEAAQQAMAAPYANPLEIRVMMRTNPGIHDRFLMVDNKLWLLGSSLNRYGSQGTMIVSITDPILVESRLEENWRQATPLETWLKERHAAE